jgi:transcriptional adapter 2-alpha
MPLRGDFDVEWHNDAELLLADMEFNEVRRHDVCAVLHSGVVVAVWPVSRPACVSRPHYIIRVLPASDLMHDLSLQHDHPAERELKIRVLEIYNHKLDERDARKRFILERNLLVHRSQNRRLVSVASFIMVPC